MNECVGNAACYLETKAKLSIVILVSGGKGLFHSLYSNVQDEKTGWKRIKQKFTKALKMLIYGFIFYREGRVAVAGNKGMYVHVGKCSSLKSHVILLRHNLGIRSW